MPLYIPIDSLKNVLLRNFVFQHYISSKIDNIPGSGSEPKSWYLDPQHLIILYIQASRTGAGDCGPATSPGPLQRPGDLLCAGQQPGGRGHVDHVRDDLPGPAARHHLTHLRASR